tara:strand:- start:195 stop:650 length:456 start_codon:yes stop_codon:yes gene_type:complete
MRVDPMVDTKAKLALNATKKLHTKLSELEEWQGVGVLECSMALDWAALKKLAADANRAVQAMQRLAHVEARRAEVSQGILREAVRDELIDREANAARVLDRQRALAESQHCATVVFDRSLTSARNVEASIGALCPNQLRVAAGVANLANGR